MNRVPEFAVQFDDAAGRRGCGPTVAAERRREGLLALLRWEAAADAHFSCSDALRFVISADGGCRIEAAANIPAGTRLLSASVIRLGVALPDGVGDDTAVAATARAARRKMVELGLGGSWLFEDDLVAEAAAVEARLGGYLRLMLELVGTRDGAIGPYLRTWPGLAATEQHPLYWPDADVEQLAGTYAQVRVRHATDDIGRIASEVRLLVLCQFEVFDTIVTTNHMLAMQST
jgi:hypothetical protein